MEGRRPGGSLIFPVILIVAGIVFLLNNLGVLGWDVWPFLWRLWPLLLIALGLDLLVGRRFIYGSVVVAVLLLTAMSGAIWYAAVRPTDVPAEAREHVIEQPVGSATEAEISIRSSVALLHIRASGDPNMLVSGRIGLLPGERLINDHAVRHQKAIVRIHSDMLRSIPSTFETKHGAQWDLDLSSRLPLSLRIGTGVGKSEIDLSGVTATYLKLDSGVGKTTVTLPEKGRLEADINVGVGDTTVYIPKGMAARIRVRTGVGGVYVAGDYRRDGDYYTSPDYETAANRVDLQLNGGVGKVSVETR